MTGSNLLSPQLLHAVGIFVVALGVLMVAAHISILALAARRTSLAASTQLLVPLVAAALLSAWVAWAALAVNELVVAPEPAFGSGVLRQPALLLVMLAMVALCLTALFGSKSMRAINAATPAAWLIGVQSYRVAGGMFLWPFLAAGALPAGFALPAGIGDMMTGIAAPIVALAVARNRKGAHTWAIAWNLFGILDLLVAPVAAVLSHSTNIARFPLVFVPLFLGPPLGILTHLYSLRNLAVTRPGLAGTMESARVLPELSRPAHSGARQ